MPASAFSSPRATARRSSLSDDCTCSGCIGRRLSAYDTAGQAGMPVLLCGNDAPVVVGGSGYRFIALDPVDDQLAYFLTRSINDGPTFVHGVVTAAIDAIVVRDHAEFLCRAQWLALKLQILNTLAQRLRHGNFIGDA